MFFGFVPALEAKLHHLVQPHTQTSQRGHGISLDASGLSRTAYFHQLAFGLMTLFIANKQSSHYLEKTLINGHFLLCTAVVVEGQSSIACLHQTLCELDHVGTRKRKTCRRIGRPTHASWPHPPVQLPHGYTWLRVPLDPGNGSPIPASSLCCSFMCHL